MAVDTTVFVSAGLYVPYQTRYRGIGTGPVGTVYVDGTATGAAGGGTVTLSIAMRAIEFGFKVLWIPTQVSVRDTLASAEVVEFVFDAAGNLRLDSAVVIPAVTVAMAQGGNSVLLDIGGIPIEGVTQAQGNVLRAVWATNTDTKAYHVHAFGPVYDMESMAKSGVLPDLMAGIR